MSVADMNRTNRVVELLMGEAENSEGTLSVSLVCRVALSALGVDGAAVSAIVDGSAQSSVFATGEDCRKLEDLQYTLSEGPSVYSHSHGAPVFVSDTDFHDSRWPLFGASAAEMGVGALFAFPLRSGAVPIGVFEVHRSRSEALTNGQLGSALILADIISVLLLSPNGEGDQDAVEEALTSERQTEVHQATGMLSVQLEVTLADALARLRARAFTDDVSVSAMAREIVQRRLRLDGGGTNV